VNSWAISPKTVGEKKKSEKVGVCVVFILELIGRELKGVHNDTDDLF